MKTLRIESSFARGWLGRKKRKSLSISLAESSASPKLTFSPAKNGPFSLLNALSIDPLANWGELEPAPGACADFGAPEEDAQTTAVTPMAAAITTTTRVKDEEPFIRSPRSNHRRGRSL